MIQLVFVGLLLGTGLMRLVEMAVSWGRMLARPGDVVAEPWLFPLMALLHTGLVFLPLAEVYLLGRAVFWPGTVAALGVLVLATVLRIWTLSTIGYAWNVRVVEPPKDAIATTGPYAFIRHPNYLVVILEIAALPMVHNAWMAALALSALNGFVLLHRIRTEEAVLARNPAWREAFGERARLVPGVF